MCTYSSLAFRCLFTVPHGCRRSRAPRPPPSALPTSLSPALTPVPSISAIPPTSSATCLFGGLSKALAPAKNQRGLCKNGVAFWKSAAAPAVAAAAKAGGCSCRGCCGESWWLLLPWLRWRKFVAAPAVAAAAEICGCSCRGCGGGNWWLLLPWPRRRKLLAAPAVAAAAEVGSAAAVAASSLWARLPPSPQSGLWTRLQVPTLPNLLQPPSNPKCAATG